MDMSARNQYLKVLQDRYFAAKSCKEKSEILDEYCRNTGQNRKYVIRKIRSPFHQVPKKRIRQDIYDSCVKVVLVRAWEIFDFPCGQRLEPLLKEEVDRLRRQRELLCSDMVAEKLKKIAPATIDRKLKHQREVLHLQRKYRERRNPLIYQHVPVKAGGWDRSLPGQVQIDLVEHCGSSAAGLFANTVSSCDIAFGWWEGEAILGSGQERTFKAIEEMRARTPFEWIKLHSDNDGSFINWHLVRYCEAEEIVFTRSRPYEKNDNCFVEQKNSTHVRNFLGHLRYDTEEEIEVINSLYHILSPYKNFFQPVMKLEKKTREKGRVHRKYDEAKTPYKRLMESDYIPETTKSKLKKVYLSLNPAQLKRDIDAKLKELYQIYEQKNNSQRVDPFKKQAPRLATQSYILNDLTTTCFGYLVK